MANTFAYLALAAWPFVAWWLFRTRRREIAIIWSFLGAFLLLPTGVSYNPPLVPAFDRESVPSLSVLVLLLLQRGTRLRLLPESGTARLLLAMLVTAPLLTTLTNGDPLRFGGTVLPGLTLYDAAAMVNTALVAILPFLIGRSLLADPSSHRDILRAFCIAAFAYSLPILFEVRMSPQLHVWFYGLRPRPFGQSIRFDAYRPSVFLRGGLTLAIFVLASLAGAAALARAGAATGQGRAEAERQRLFYVGATLYLAVVFVLCRSVGAISIALVVLPAVLLLGPMTQLRLAAAIGVIVLVYPVLYSNGLIPTDALLDMAEGIRQEARGSLRVRFENEAALLARALERPLFGWGRWSRNRIFDPDTGEDITITDGFWVITIGVGGWFGYIATFGLLSLPLVLLWWRSRRRVGQISRETAAIALIIGANLIYSIPNSEQSNWLWMMAGALLGHAEKLGRVPSAATASAAPPTGAPPVRPRLGYTRPAPVPVGRALQPARAPDEAMTGGSTKASFTPRRGSPPAHPLPREPGP